MNPHHDGNITKIVGSQDFGAKEFFIEEEAAEYSKTALERFLAAIDFTQEAAISGDRPGRVGEASNVLNSRPRDEETRRYMRVLHEFVLPAPTGAAQAARRSA